MNQAIEAHIRILQATPRERIHTHERRYAEPHYGQLENPPRALSVLKQERVMALLAEGMNQRQVGKTLHMAESTVSKFVSRARAGQRG